MELKQVQNFILEVKGFQSINRSWRGDFIFTVNVQVPKKLTTEQRRLINKTLLKR